MNQNQRVNACPIDIYIPSNMPYEYPYKLGKPSYATQRIRDSCETFILDSGIGDDTTNREVLTLAIDLDADFVVPVDILHNQAETIESIHEFLDLYEDSECHATPLIPLQPPHVKMFDEFPNQPAYLLGGISPSLSEFSILDVLEYITEFRDVVGMSPYLHVLGVGASPVLAEFIRENPGFVQSIDCSTPEQCVINGKVFDLGLKQQPYELRSGEKSSLARYQLARHLAFMLNDAFREKSDENQSTLGVFA